MDLISEQKIIRTISGLMMFGYLIAYFLGLANPAAPLIDLTSAAFLKSLSYGMAACLLPYFFLERSIKERLAVFGTGIVLDIVLFFILDKYFQIHYLSFSGFMLSLIGFSISAMWVTAVKKPANGENLRIRNQLVGFYAFVLTIQLVATRFLDVTFSMEPNTYDAVVYHLDAMFGFNPSVEVAKIVNSSELFRNFVNMFYSWEPLIFPLLFILQIKQKKASPANIMTVWAVSLVALLAYHFCPVAGPGYFFGKAVFPDHVPPSASIPTESIILLQSTYRNGFPSLHFGCALLFVFTGRYLKSVWLNVALLLCLILTAITILGNGEHYLMDIIVSFPFMVAIQSFCTHVDTFGKRARLQAVGAGAAIWLAWVVLVRYGYVLFETIPGLVWVLSIATVAASLYMYQRLWPHEVWGYHEPESVTNELSLSQAGIPGLLFISGFFGLICTVALFKGLAVTLAGTTTLTYSLLAVFMSAIAAGAWFGTHVIAPTRKHALVVYAVCGLIIGVYCLAAPILLSLLQDLYVHLAQGYAPDSPVLELLGIVCGGLILVIPAILTGLTLPVMARELHCEDAGAGTATARLYSFSLLGAAAGSLLSGYFIFPFLGLSQTLAFSAAGSLMVGLFALKLSKQTVPHHPTGDRDAGSYAPSLRLGRGSGSAWLLAVSLTGCVALLVAVNYIQLLGAVAGTSPYVTSLLLFSIMIGLGGGAKAAHYLLNRISSAGLLFSLLLFGLAIVLQLNIFQWNNLSSMFDSYGPFSFHPGFSARETVRAYACWLMIIPPAVLIGACFAVALDLAVTDTDRALQVKVLGRVIGVHAMGCIAGIILGAFVLLPLFGIQKSIYITAALCLIAGLIVVLKSQLLKNPFVYGSVCVSVLLMAVQPGSFNYTSIASGGNVFFQAQNNGFVIARSESLDGGLTTVSVKETKGIKARQVHTLVVNGMKQGDDSFQDDARVQLSLAAASLMHTVSRTDALIIGYATGVSANAIKLAGFRQLDVVDQNYDLVNLSNKYFSDVNGKVSEQAGVRTFISDGRNFLRLRVKKYDLISVKMASIAEANAAPFYNRDFYELASARMTDNGVLQQWVSLNHLTALDLTGILGTIRVVFPEVSLYIVGDQGIIIAAKTQQNLPEQMAIDSIQSQPELMKLFRRAGLTEINMTSQLLLSPVDIDRLVKISSSNGDLIISNDDNLALLYSTPKGNALNTLNSKKQLLKFLMQFSTQLQNQSENSNALIKGFMDS